MIIIITLPMRIRQSIIIVDNKNDDTWDIYSSLLGMSLNDLTGKPGEA